MGASVSPLPVLVLALPLEVKGMSQEVSWWCVYCFVCISHP